MKKILLLATFAVAGLVGNLNAKNTIVLKNSNINNAKVIKAATECYVRAYDKNGRYLGLFRVPCPGVIILR